MGLKLIACRDVPSADDTSCLDIHLHNDTCEDDALTGYEVMALKTGED